MQSHLSESAFAQNSCLRCTAQCGAVTWIVVFSDNGVCVYVCVAQEVAGPAVWLQLLERCVAEHNCQPTALCSLAQQLADQRVLTVQQQQQISDQQQQLSAQQQQILDQQQQLLAQQQQGAAQQQQLLAQQQATAQQGSQVLTLQAQLQVMQSQLQELLQRQQHQ